MKIYKMNSKYIIEDTTGPHPSKHVEFMQKERGCFSAALLSSKQVYQVEAIFRRSQRFDFGKLMVHCLHK